MKTIPYADPSLDNIVLLSDLTTAISHVIKSGKYVLGEEVLCFEDEFATFLGVEGAIGVSSGTAAIVLGLAALGIGSGDEVIMPSHTAVATASAVITSGARPVFADVENDFFTIDSESVQRVITDKTKAVIAVHLYGQPANINALQQVCRRYNLALIEDCAQAIGSKFGDRTVGTIGDVGCFSFYPTKNLGAIGDAGCVIAKSPEVEEKIRRLRQYGWGKDRTNTAIHGFNARLDEVQAAILRIKLQHLKEYNQKRRRLAALYSQKIQNPQHPVFTPKIRSDCIHTFHLYVIRCKNRARVQQYLANKGIATGIHYKIPVHRQDGYSCFVGREPLEITDKVCGEILSLPLFPALTLTDTEHVVDAINSL